MKDELSFKLTFPIQWWQYPALWLMRLLIALFGFRVRV